MVSVTDVLLDFAYGFFRIFFIFELNGNMIDLSMLIPRKRQKIMTFTDPYIHYFFPEEGCQRTEYAAKISRICFCSLRL